MAEPWFGVLVEKETGAEYTFHSRAEYLATFYAGGYREKNLDEPAPPPAPAREPEPAPQPRRRAWREPVNDQPVVETAPNE